MDSAGTGLFEKLSLILVSYLNFATSIPSASSSSCYDLLTTDRPHHDLSKTNHVQEAISFSFRQGKPYLSLYLSQV